jgi:hypothetical protein
MIAAITNRSTGILGIPNCDPAAIPMYEPKIKVATGTRAQSEGLTL